MAARPSHHLRASLGRAVHCVIPAAGPAAAGPAAAGPAVGGSSVIDCGFVRLDETTEPLLGSSTTPASSSTTRSPPSSASAFRPSSQLFCHPETTSHSTRTQEADRATKNFDDASSKPTTTVFCFLRGLSISSTITSVDASAEPVAPIVPQKRPTLPDKPRGPVNETKQQWAHWDLDESQPHHRHRRVVRRVGANTVAAPRSIEDSPTKSCMTFPPHHRSLSAKLAEERRATHRGGLGSIQTCPAAPSPAHPGKAAESQRPPSHKSVQTRLQPRQQPQLPTGATPRDVAPRITTPRSTHSASRTPRSPGSPDLRATSSLSNAVDKPKSPPPSSGEAISVPSPENGRTGRQESSPRKPQGTAKRSVVNDARALESKPRLQASSRDVSTRRKAAQVSAVHTATLDPRRVTKPVHPPRRPRTQHSPQCTVDGNPSLKPPSCREDRDATVHNRATKRPLAPKAKQLPAVPKHVEFATAAAVRSGGRHRRPQQPRSPRSVTSTETPTETTELSMTLSGSNHSSSKGGDIDCKAPLQVLASPWETFSAADASLDHAVGSHSIAPSAATQETISATRQAPTPAWAFVSEPFGNDDFMSWDPNDFDFDFDDDDFFAVKVD